MNFRFLIYLCFLFSSTSAYSQYNKTIIRIKLNYSNSFFYINYGRNVGLNITDTLYGVEKTLKPTQFIVVELSQSRAKLLSRNGKVYNFDSVYFKMDIPKAQENIFINLAKNGIYVQLDSNILNSPNKIYRYNQLSESKLLHLISNRLYSLADTFSDKTMLNKGKFRHCSLSFALKHIDNNQVQLFFNYIASEKAFKNHKINIETAYLNWLISGQTLSNQDFLAFSLTSNTENDLKIELKKKDYQYNIQSIQYILNYSHSLLESNTEKSYKSAKIAEILSLAKHNDSLRLKSLLAQSEAMAYKRNFEAANFIVHTVLAQTDSLSLDKLWMNALLDLLKQKIFDSSCMDIENFQKKYLSLLNKKELNVNPEFKRKITILFYEGIGDYYFLRKTYNLAQKNYSLAVEISKKAIYNEQELVKILKKLSLCENNF